MRARGFVAGCALALVMTPPVLAQGEQDRCDGPFPVILGGGYPTQGTEQPQFRVIDNKTDWCIFWDQVLAEPPFLPAPPCDTSKIDFAHEAAIVINPGWGLDSCHGMDVCVSRRGHSGNFDIAVTKIVPGPNCICRAVILSLMRVLKVQRPVRRVEFTQEVEFLECPQPDR